MFCIGTSTEASARNNHGRKLHLFIGAFARKWRVFFVDAQNRAALDNLWRAEFAGKEKRSVAQLDTLIAKTPRTLLDFTTRTHPKAAGVY